MKHLFILGPDRQPIHVEDVLTWARWYETAKRDIEGSPWESNGVRVSTVFLGINSNFNFSDPTAEPVLWETMIFGGEHDGYQRRYTSDDDARTGHAMTILIVEGKTTPDAIEEVEKALA
jgi:hypothetical protein